MAFHGSAQTSMASSNTTVLTTQSIDQSSGTSRKSRVPEASKVEMVQVQKQKLDLLLAKYKAQETQIESYRNLHLFIQDLEQKNKQEKAKNAQLETALVSAESRLVDWVKAQLDKPDSPLEILPDLLYAESPQRKPVAVVSKSQQTEIEETEGKARFAPHYARSAPDMDCFTADDIEIDGEQNQERSIHVPMKDHFTSLSSVGSKDSGYPASILSSTSSGYSSRRTTQDLLSCTDSSSIRPSSISQMKDERGTQTTSTVSPAEYEDIINSQTRELAKRKLYVVQLQRLLEAKKNNNCDVFSQQFTAALRKNDELTKSNKQKDLLLNNYAKAYAALAEKTDITTSTESQVPVSKSDVDSLETDQLKILVHSLQGELAQLKEVYQRELVELKAKLLKESQIQQDLEAKLKGAQATIEALHQTRRTTDELPRTMGELRDENSYLTETLALKEKTTTKLMQEKEHLLAQSDLLRVKQRELQEQNTSLQMKVKELSEELAKNETPDEKVDGLKNELESQKKHIISMEEAKGKVEDQRDRLHRELDEVLTEKEKERENWQRQLKLVTDSRRKVDEQLRDVQSQNKQILRRIQQYQKQAEEQQQLILQLQKDQGSPPKASATSSDAIVECDRCFREFKITDYDKYEAHIARCQDE